MPQVSPLSRLLAAIVALLLAGCTMVIAPITPSPNATLPATAEATETRASDVSLFGMITVPNNTIAFDTPVGGLSAMAYDAASDTYYFLSDDRANFGPTRVYAATIDVSDGNLAASDLTWTEMIPLLDASGAPFDPMAIDPEGLVVHDGNFFVSSEGDLRARPPIAPAILRFTVAGEFVASLPLPDKFMPTGDGSRGVRHNKGFESLTLTPDGRYLIAGVENALWQDGPAASVEHESYARLLTLDLAGDAPGPQARQEQVYVVDAIPFAPLNAGGESDNGLVDLIALDDAGMLLAMERAYAVGVGNSVRLYVANAAGATDVSAFDSLIASMLYSSVNKELLVDFGALGRAYGLAPDNLEGMTLGPQLPDGRHLLFVVSDNNFNLIQTTQLWALALTLPLAEKP